MSQRHDPNTRSARLPGPPPRLLARLALAARRALLALADAVVPPQLALFDHVSGAGFTMVIHAAARLRIPDLLAERPMTAAELAARAGVDADTLHRTLRGLAASGVFSLDAAGRFRNNRLSTALLSGRPGSLRDYAVYFGSASNVLAWADFDRTLETGGQAFARVHGTPVWDWFDAHPDERETFAGAMGALTELYAAGVAAFYPFAEVQRLCDVGGGRGTLLAEVLLRHPHLAGVLLDGEGVIATARSFLGEKGVGDRVELVAGSFFTAVPPGCDAYLLKNVLHDWDDERCRTILGACRRAMQPGDRLLVVETVVEATTTRDLGPLSDLQMMVVCGGRERGREEFARLYAETGFRLSRIVTPPGPMSVIEGIAV